MRRGNVVIGGDIGSGSCLELISGSVVILGKLVKTFVIKLVEEQSLQKINP